MAADGEEEDTTPCDVSKEDLKAAQDILTSALSDGDLTTVQESNPIDTLDLEQLFEHPKIGKYKFLSNKSYKI